MIKILKSINIPGKTQKEVYDCLKRFENYPSFIPHIKSLKILSKGEGNLISDWETVVDNITIQWKEQDSFDDARCQISFEMLEGDYKSYFGAWSVEGIGNGSKIIIEANFDWGIPVLEQYVTKTLERKAKTALFGMLKAFKKELGGSR
jgi:ribosome-associated toxin RatA of RatAB toxin-antitoxin module